MKPSSTKNLLFLLFLVLLQREFFFWGGGLTGPFSGLSIQYRSLPSEISIYYAIWFTRLVRYPIMVLQLPLLKDFRHTVAR